MSQAALLKWHTGTASLLRCRNLLQRGCHRRLKKQAKHRLRFWVQWSFKHRLMARTLARLVSREASRAWTNWRNAADLRNRQYTTMHRALMRLRHSGTSRAFTLLHRQVRRHAAVVFALAAHARVLRGRHLGIAMFTWRAAAVHMKSLCSRARRAIMRLTAQKTACLFDTWRHAVEALRRRSVSALHPLQRIALGAVARAYFRWVGYSTTLL